MIVIDTNVVSELMRLTPEPAVMMVLRTDSTELVSELMRLTPEPASTAPPPGPMAWFSGQDSTELYIAVIDPWAGDRASH